MALVVMRLHPDSPVDGLAFNRFLDGLSIRVFDLGLAHGSGEVLLGLADYLPPFLRATDPPVPDPRTGIVQHWGQLEGTFAPIGFLAVATAAIEVPSSAGPEHGSRDLRVEVARAKMTRLNGAVTADASTVVVDDSSAFPVRVPFRLIIDYQTGDAETVLVTAATGSTLTVTRGMQGGAVPHDSGASVAYLQPLVTSGQLYFNTPLWHEAATPPVYQAIPVTSLYMSIGDPANDLDPTDAFVTVPPDGMPPEFDDLRAAVEIVLGNDPGGGQRPSVANLTPPQARHVAYEIAWNQKFRPLPAPSGRTLEQLYTLPDSEGAQGDEATRARFEGDLQAYYATGDAEAERLAGFVYALSTAVAAEARTSAADRAGFLVPVVPAADGRGSRFKSVRVILTGRAPDDQQTMPASLATAFTVPAAYFYALGATMPAQVDAHQRFQMATLQEEENLRGALRAAAEAGVIVPRDGSGDPDPGGDIDGVNIAQAARRLRSLGAVRGVAPQFAVNDTNPPSAPNAQERAAVRLLVAGQGQVSGWLGSRDDDIGGFWGGRLTDSQRAGHLELVLRALTDGHQPLVDAIKALPGPVERVENLENRSERQWRDVFGDPVDPALLPGFTQPGSPAERVTAFLQHVQKFFSVEPAVDPTSRTSSGQPRLRPLDQDPLTAFAAHYAAITGGPFEFGGAAGLSNVSEAVRGVFPDDGDASLWLEQLIATVDELTRLARGLGIPPELRFSVMEALYARGITSRAQVGMLSVEQLRTAVIGTVAYEHAAAISALGSTQVPETPSPEGGFMPVNPDGCLVNCVPPPQWSPLGPVAYLHELLELTRDSTCDGLRPGGESPTIGELLSGRRGPVGDLQVTRANLHTPLPLIDLVNECLEAIAAHPDEPVGAVRDTSSDSLAGHALDVHDPATLYAAVPEHSTPATPVAEPDAYTTLRRDFSAPGLPYARALDVNRTYLGHLRTSRYATMRRFRRDITEPVLDPNGEPPGFQRHLWRYPVRVDIAREYLGISPQEYDLLFTQDLVDAPAQDRLRLREMYGFPEGEVGGRSWAEIVVGLPEFLARTGLSYCEFLDLWRSEFVTFGRADEDEDEDGFPDCEPCHLDDYRLRFQDPEDPIEALRCLAVFVRLWRKLRELPGAGYSFTRLNDICTVLELYDAEGAINPDFVRQLAAFQILRDDFGLALTDGTEPAPGAVGAARTHLLALWVGPTADAWDWAVDELLDQVQHYAQARHGARPRPPEFVKLLAQNLDPLSQLAGFDPTPAGHDSGDTWRARPTHTLRFAEVLAKICASEFGVGEILYLFTAGDHLGGDDPFPLQPDNEALDSPLDLPDDAGPHTLWQLRRKLLDVQVSDEEAATWNWSRIDTAMQASFGFTPAASAQNPLLVLGQHCFPSILAASGVPVTAAQRQYRVDLAETGTAPQMWNTPPHGPFRYDVAAQQLYTELPVTDEAVIAKLSRIRQLSESERAAVRELYFLPRADLAPFAFVFESLAEAQQRLLQEPDEHRRWAWFQRQFATCLARCQVIAEHLAAHVYAWTGQERAAEATALAWRLLQHLSADENRATTSWEDDLGQPPTLTWPDRPTGGAFAALLGLAGTGLHGEFTPAGVESVAWREVRGPLDAFGDVGNAANVAVPTVLPAMDLTLTPAQERFVSVRNGFAIANPDGAPLGGGQGFTARWHGTLLIEQDGTYQFRAGAPTPGQEPPDVTAAKDKQWRVMLQRGQRTWVLLSHRWPDETVPGDGPAPLPLRRGAYELTVELTQLQPTYHGPDDVRPVIGGFQVKYAGPDTGADLVAIPREQLFRTQKDQTLSFRLRTVTSAADSVLRLHYTSSLRDVRRTYQRAFKALLFAARFALSADPVSDDGQSEIGYMLAHPDRFLGTSYYRDGEQFGVHRAWFDPNLLPLRDNHHPPRPAQDGRVRPSPRRQQALFDWWERTFDYTAVRRDARTAPERPLWLLFHEAAESHPDEPAQLLRHMGVDLLHARLVLRFFLADPITSADLEDDRWVVRAWHADTWIRGLPSHFLVPDIRTARPDLWASDDPDAATGQTTTGQTESGNANLTRFVREGCIDNGEPRRYEDVQRLNDQLRERGRRALLAHLCRMNRVRHGREGVTEPRQLSALLLLDVEAGVCQRASRVEEAITAVQAFVHRGRLGLEPAFRVGPGFALLWGRRFATFQIWQRHKQRQLYRENWIQWAEFEQARHSEAFRLLESELRRATLTVPVPGGVEYWPDRRPPSRPSLSILQAREPAGIHRIDHAHHGFDLLGIPQRHARPSWLSPLGLAGGVDGQGHGGTGPDDDDGDGDDEPLGLDSVTSSERLPLWIQAAIRVGSRFVRVAAAGEPPASTQFRPRSPDQPPCCQECGQPHPATVDEYYFWLLDTRHYTPQGQHADQGAGTVQPGPDGEGTAGHPWTWRDPTTLPKLLSWQPEPVVHLAWCRVHNGEFQQPRRSHEGLPVPRTGPELIFRGRTGDSLRFEVPEGATPAGHADPTSPGFRYDIATDTAVPLPHVLTPPGETTLAEAIDEATTSIVIASAPDDLPAPPFTLVLGYQTTIAENVKVTQVTRPATATPPTTTLTVVRGTYGTTPAGHPGGTRAAYQPTSPGQLPAYPYFSYVAPGAPVLPPSPFAPAVAVAATLRAHCQFEAALKWYDLVFAAQQRDSSWLRCPDEDTDDDGSCCHDSTLATPAEVRDRAIVLHHLETLHEWQHAVQLANTPEAFQHARLLLDTAARLLGPPPRTVIAADPDGEPGTVSAFIAHAAPLNPRLLGLYQQNADSRALIEACLNACRHRPSRRLPWGDGRSPGDRHVPQACLDETDWCTPPSPYRFTVLVQRAQELAGEVRGLGAALLAAYEKGDAEYLAALRATHERQLLDLTLRIRQDQWREADWQVQALNKTKQIAQTNHRYHTLLIQNGLNNREGEHDLLINTSIGNRTAGNIYELISQIMNVIPDIFVGLAPTTWVPLGTKLSGLFSAAARVANTLADISSSTGGLRLTQAGWERREEEWRHQVDVLDLELQQIERQLLAAERRRDIALRELNNHQIQIDQSRETHDFLRDKFTNHDLYLFLQQETAALHQQMYTLALHGARC